MAVADDAFAIHDIECMFPSCPPRDRRLCFATSPFGLKSAKEGNAKPRTAAQAPWL